MNISWLETFTSEATCDVHSLPLNMKYVPLQKGVLFLRCEGNFRKLFRTQVSPMITSIFTYEKCRSVSH